MDPAIPVAILGPAGSGKTLLIRSITNNQNQVYPTAGIQITYISTTSRTLLVYDSSGEGSSRSNWELLSNLSTSIIYVIDSTKPQVFANAKRHLYTFLQENKSIKYKNLCIMLNKCDIKDRPSKDLYIKALQQDKLVKLVGKLYIRQTSAFSKQGLDQCLQWIIKNSLSSNDK